MKWFRWGDELLDSGYVQVPNALVKRQAELDLSPTDMDLIVQAAACFRQDDTMSPSGRILAERMGISERQVTRLKKRLMSLGYLECTERNIAGRRTTDDWDFSGLMDSLKHLMSERPDTDVTPAPDAEVTGGPDTDVTTSHTTKQTTTHTISKDRYGEFKNVLLTVDEHQKIGERFGIRTAIEKIEALSTYKKSKGKTYKDDYATILNWARKDGNVPIAFHGDKTDTRSNDPDKYVKGAYGHMVNR